MAVGSATLEAPVISPSKWSPPAEEGSMSLHLDGSLLSTDTTAPTEGSLWVGYDLCNVYDCTVPPMEKTLVQTNIEIALTSGCCRRVAPRSALGAKHFREVGAGVIDAD
ncbi:deoxyuridine 5'-triphosphate nucleotidohydrolase, mitochondrial-like [Desmodus rotundus]|uniref:deoxyuridine 5'-triphosphate nucleotidohydrolase, mitochondrial-like n=1 Tax=Desmodus rotundus TaxID=9430 RepID=UPI0039E249E5